MRVEGLSPIGSKLENLFFRRISSSVKHLVPGKWSDEAAVAGPRSPASTSGQGPTPERAARTARLERLVWTVQEVLCGLVWFYAKK